eukprot:15460117-Alexandrium_andersonii.AAC.1
MVSWQPQPRRERVRLCVCVRVAPLVGAVDACWQAGLAAPAELSVLLVPTARACGFVPACGFPAMVPCPVALCL